MASVADPLAAALADIIAAYRKIIVLVQEESSLSPVDRERVYHAGPSISEENESQPEITNRQGACLRATTHRQAKNAKAEIAHWGKRTKLLTAP